MSLLSPGLSLFAIQPETIFYTAQSKVNEYRLVMCLEYFPAFGISMISPCFWLAGMDLLLSMLFSAL